MRVNGPDSGAPGAKGPGITSTNQAERALQESEERYWALVDNTADLIYSLDASVRYAAVNRSLCQALDRLPEEILGKSPAELGLPEEVDRRWRALYERVLRGEVIHTETRAPIPGGDARLCETALTPVHDSAGEVVGICCMIRDITERRRLEDQVRQAQKMEAVGRLAGGVAHDFNNLVTVIKSFAGFVLSQLRPSDPAHSDLLEVIKAADRAAGLTRQLLAFSRKSLVEPRELDLNTTVTDVGRMLRRIVGEDVELSVRLSDGLWPVRADVGQIEQVLTNLVVNARDAMPRGGKITLETANAMVDGDYLSKHPQMTAGPYVMLAVSDNGEGIPVEVQQFIFEPFFSTKSEGRGTGLGLATVYGIVKQAGGFIWVYSEPGCGATFKIYLPRAVGADRRSSSTSSTHVALALARGAGLRVLLVEDEAALRSATRRMLQSEGFEVIEAENGVDALRRTADPGLALHLVLTDVVMPIMGGKQLVDELRRTRPDLPAIYMSGHTENAVVHHGVLDEGTIFLSKPFNKEALLRKIAQALAPLQSELAGARAPGAGLERVKTAS